MSEIETSGGGVPFSRVEIPTPPHLTVENAMSPSVASGPGFMPHSAVGAPLVLHLCLVDVSLTCDERVTHATLVVAELRPVPVVELLDDLKGPPALQHVATDQFRLQAFGDFAVSGRPQIVTGLAEPKTRRSSRPRESGA